MGFNQKVIDMIRECVTTVQFLVLINGTPRGCFKDEKGIRQGDPLSPYLFIMIAEFLSRNVVDLVINGRLHGFKAASTIPPLVSNNLSMTPFCLVCHLLWRLNNGIIYLWSMPRHLGNVSIMRRVLYSSSTPLMTFNLKSSLY